MTDLNLDPSSSNSIWGLVINIALLLLAMKFPILFLFNGLIGVGLGLYFLISSYTKLSDSSLTDEIKIVYNFENFMGWVSTIIGVVCIIIYFFLRNKSKNSY